MPALAVLSTQERDQLVYRGHTDPLWWIDEVLGSPLWGLQKRAVTSVQKSKTTAIATGNSLGKTYVAARVVLWFLYNHRPSIVLTTAPTGRQVPALLWKEIHMAHAESRYPLGGRLLSQQLQLDKNWFALGFTTNANTPNSFAGFHEANVLAVVDESPGVSQSIHEGIDGILASGHARKLELGNPLDRNTPFGQSFRMPSVSKIRMGAFESPNFTEFGITLKDIRSGEWERKVDGRPMPWPKLVSPGWVREKWEKWGEKSAAWVARVLGQFPDSSPDAVFPGEFIRRAQELILTPRDTAQKILAVDVARFGDDETAFALRHGPRVRIVYRSLQSKPNTMATAGRAILAAREHGATKIYVDVVGMGGGVVDRLREINPDGIEIQGVNFGAQAKDSERYMNVRAECYWTVRERMERGQLDIDAQDQDLEAELSGIRSTNTSGGKIVIESKESMRKRGIPSPNLADAVAIAYADAFEPEPARVW